MKRINNLINWFDSRNLEIFLNRIVDNCDFLVLFCIILTTNNEIYFSIDDLKQYVNICKDNDNYKDLLKNIYIIDEHNSFNKAINILKIDKDIMLIKDKTNTAIITKNLNLKDIYKYSNDTISEMTNFINDFYIFKDKQFVKSKTKKAI